MTNTPNDRSDFGFTIIEALVVLTIAAVAFAMAPLAFNLSQKSLAVAAYLEHRASSHRVLAALTDRIAAARPIFETGSSGLSSLAFEGGPDHLRFVAEFADGPAGGGLYRIELGIDPATANLALSLTPYASNRDNTQAATIMSLLSTMRLALRYFGPNSQTGYREWRQNWANSTSLPDLIELSLTSSHIGSALPPAIVALRLAN